MVLAPMIRVQGEGIYCNAFSARRDITVNRARKNFGTAEEWLTKVNTKTQLSTRLATRD